MEMLKRRLHRQVWRWLGKAEQGRHIRGPWHICGVHSHGTGWITKGMSRDRKEKRIKDWALEPSNFKRLREKKANQQDCLTGSRQGSGKETPESWRSRRPEKRAHRGRESRAGSTAAGRSSTARMQNCPPDLATRRPW